MKPVRKVVFGYIGQFYSAVIGLLMLPFLVRQIGAEAYGLVGFFATLQSWFFLLDAGMFQTTSREVARCTAGVVSTGHLWSLLGRVEIFVLAIACGGFVVLTAISPSIGSHWLKVSELQPATVTLALRLMAAAIALRWVTGLYRQVLLGLNQQEWLAGYTVAASSLRFILVLPVIAVFERPCVAYFGWQTLVSSFELAVVWWRARHSLPRRPSSSVHVAWAPLLKFSAGAAGASLLWIAITQVDKLLLSRLLTLAEFGLASIVGLLAGGILFAVTPIGSVALPTLTRLYAGQPLQEFIRCYRMFTQSVAVVAATIGAPLMLCSNDVLRIWTNSTAAKSSTGLALALYAAGNLLSAVNSPGYYLQYAVGSLRWHNVGSAVSLTLLVCGVIYGAPRFGLVGAAAVWVGVNLLYLTIWMPFVHGKFLPGQHLKWIMIDIITPVLAAVAAAWCSSLISWDSTFPWSLAKLAVTGALAGGAGLVSASLLLPELVQWLSVRFKDVPTVVPGE